MMKYVIATLGCKVNQYETQAVETFLQQAGLEPASPGETADVVIVNSCAVTAESGRKSRQTLRRLMDENPGALAAVSGCYSQLDPKALENLGADVIYGSADRKDFADAILRACRSRSAGENVPPIRNIDRPFRRRVFESLPAGAVNGRTRAMLKIQDGCVNFCTYCIIPYTRGRLRSISIEEAVRETERIRDMGYRELVLTGIEIASWGRENRGRDTSSENSNGTAEENSAAPGLEDLICAVADHAGNMRLRLGSLEPTLITEHFARTIADTGKMCRHFHLSLQSGCDRTLQRMNRKYDTSRFLEAVELLRRFFPGCALTADLITGFPGETEEDHRQTLEYLRRCGFAFVHVFPYSRRPGTPADRMPDQNPAAVKDRRASEARAVVQEVRQQVLEQCIGTVLPVLFEHSEPEGSTGHSDTYLPVRVQQQVPRGACCSVRVTGVLPEGEGLTGVLL